MATKKKTLTPEELVEEIRKKAFELYEARHGQDGSDENDWYQAEKEVKKHFSTAK